MYRHGLPTTAATTESGDTVPAINDNAYLYNLFISDSYALNPPNIAPVVNRPYTLTNIGVSDILGSYTLEYIV